MADIDGGALSFKAILDNGQINDAINETLRRIQGLSDATVSGGKVIDGTFLKTADNIREALGQVGRACEIHEAALNDLKAKYEQLGAASNAAFESGDDAKGVRLKNEMMSVQGEIETRKQLLQEARNLSDVLEKEAAKREESTRAIEANAQANQSLRARIRELKEEMALLIDQGIDQQSESYKVLVNELGRLQDIQGDIAQQGKILANDEAKFQGFIQGLSGLSGAFSAATGAISLFAGENENLQKVMTKVQSVMAIAIGMEQVAQTLNKDSAFQLVTLNGLKEWWTGIVAKATVAETAETVATVANTTAQQAQTAATTQNTIAQGANTVATGAQTAAATAGTVANFTLAGAFRAVGLAIKSIPVFGWVLAGISALIALVSHFSSKARETKKAQEEFSKAMIEGCYKPIGKVEELSVKYTALGDNIKEKEQFIKDNKKAFDELGVSVTSVRDAENLLINNKEAFISAQIAKAKAMVYTQQATEKIKKQMELQAEYESMSDTRSQWVQTSSFGTGYYIQVENTAKKEKKKEIDDLNAEIRDGYKKATEEETAALKEMKQSGINAVKTYAKGTVGAIEQAISEKQEALKDLVPNSAEWNKKNKEIEALQKQLAKPKSNTSSKAMPKPKNGKDPFVEQLEKRKAEYERFYKWQNSSNEDVRNAAKTEFAELIKNGSSYEAFLKRLHDEISSLHQNSHTEAKLRAIRDELAEINKTTVLEAFNEAFQKELDGTDNVLERLDIIAKKREELKKSGDADTKVGEEKTQALDDAEKNELRKQQEETRKLLDDYASYLDRKIKLDLQYSNDLALLEKARAKATTDEERKSIDAAIANRKRQYDKDSKLSGDSDYDQMLQTYRTFEQKKEGIVEEFNEKRKIAQEHGNTEMLAQLDKAQKEALSKLAIDEMKISPDWEKMFGNLDEIGTKELERLLATIEGKTAILGIELSPEDFKVIQDKIKELKNEIKERNPFKALTKGFEDLKKATSDQDKVAALAGMFDSAGKAGNQLKGIISDVTSTLEALGVEGTEEIEHAIQALDGLASGAQDAIMGYMSGNPVQAVGGTIKAIGSVVNFFAGANDRRAERSIKKHQENVNRLTSAYKGLEWQISKALGGEVYKHQQASIENMKQQQRELDGMIRAEQSKKKTDKDKIKEWQERKKELDRAIADTMESISKDILQTDAKSAANELGDALVAAFAKGEDAAKGFDDVVNNILKNAVLNQLKKNFLENQMNEALKGLEKSMGYWTGSGDNKKFVFDGLTDDEIARFKEQAGQAADGFKEAMKVYDELFKDILTDNDSSLTGAVKGVTEETASIVAGQLNAMRINQVEANNMLRQQLSALSQIVQNTSYNRHLEKLDGILSTLKGQQSDPLRSHGLQ